ncbi:hypothetical protein COB21_02840 [Candidatus Aerophobetes bacterium]|uniref:Uncharacterized protein n=1 Tax=Aerophobetes bacterium TaxID=2030807 RepID=A0A2A4X4N9_UNCAE|nr:MAG: hypothetical protein COB21_02840 [Candidatus Aerophobetes bacterium]
MALGRIDTTYANLTGVQAPSGPVNLSLLSSVLKPVDRLFTLIELNGKESGGLPRVQTAQIALVTSAVVFSLLRRSFFKEIAYVGCGFMAHTALSFAANNTSRFQATYISELLENKLFDLESSPALLLLIPMIMLSHQVALPMLGFAISQQVFYQELSDETFDETFSALRHRATLQLDSNADNHISRVYQISLVQALSQDRDHPFSQRFMKHYHAVPVGVPTPLEAVIKAALLDQTVLSSSTSYDENFMDSIDEDLRIIRPTGSEETLPAFNRNLYTTTAPSSGYSVEKGKVEMTTLALTISVIAAAALLSNNMNWTMSTAIMSASYSVYSPASNHGVDKTPLFQLDSNEAALGATALLIIALMKRKSSSSFFFSFTAFYLTGFAGSALGNYVVHLHPYLDAPSNITPDYQQWPLQDVVQAASNFPLNHHILPILHTKLEEVENFVAANVLKSILAGDDATSEDSRCLCLAHLLNALQTTKEYTYTEASSLLDGLDANDLSYYDAQSLMKHLKNMKTNAFSQFKKGSTAPEMSISQLLKLSLDTDKPIQELEDALIQHIDKGYRELQTTSIPLSTQVKQSMISAVFFNLDQIIQPKDLAKALSHVRSNEDALMILDRLNTVQPISLFNHIHLELKRDRLSKEDRTYLLNSIGQAMQDPCPQYVYIDPATINRWNSSNSQIARGLENLRARLFNYNDTQGISLFANPISYPPLFTLQTRLYELTGITLSRTFSVQNLIGTLRRIDASIEELRQGAPTPDQRNAAIQLLQTAQKPTSTRV